MKDNALISVRGLEKSFGKDIQVLKGIDIDIFKGDVVVVLGPSGSGKSTLLRCATFLETMDDGNIIYMDDEVVKSENGHSVYGNKEQQKRALSYFGLVFQNFNLFPHFTVLKNIIDAPIRIQKRNKEEVIAEARALLAQMGLSDKENAYPGQLSGGQQQRVAIARALMMKPQVLLFDEPTAALDPEITAQVVDIIKELQQTGITQVIVTHEVNVAQKVATKVVYMEQGKIIEMGSADCFDNPKTEQFKQYLSHSE